MTNKTKSRLKNPTIQAALISAFVLIVLTIIGWLIHASRSGNSVQQNNTTTNIGDIKDNIDTQVNVNSPNSKQIINQTRKIKKECDIQKNIDQNGVYITKIILTQTDGIWDQGETFKMQLKFSGSFKEYKFIQGFLGGLQNVKEGINEEKTTLYFETTTAPLKEPIILEIKSEADINIERISVSPLE